MKGEDGDYCSDGTGDEDGDGRTNVSSNSNNSNNNTTTNNNSNVPRFQNSSDENRTNRDEASRSSNNSSLLRYPGNNGNNVDEVIGAVIVSSIENVVDDFRRPIVVPTREIISEGNDNVMKTTAAAAAATATATSEQITRTNNNTTTPMINPTSLNTSYNNNTNNNNDEMNINLLNMTDDSFFEIASLDVASSENAMDISLIHKNNWPSFFDSNMAKDDDDDDEDDDGGKNKCNFGVEEGRKEGEKKVVVGRGNDNNGDDDLSSPLSNLRNTSASINDVDLSFSRTDHDSDLLSSPPLVLGNNDSTVMNDDLDISFISNSSNGILGNNKYKHYTNLAIINNNNSNTNNNNSVIDSDVLVEDNSSIHQQSSEIPLFTSSSSSSSPKPHPNPMMQQQQQQQQQQHQQVNINNNPQQQQQQQQQHHQNNDHQNINQEEQQEDQQHHYGLPLPPRQFSSAPTAREQLIERERQARLERERARLKMQMAHSREQQRDEGSYVSDDDDDIQDGDGAGGGIGNGIAGNGIGGGNNIGGDDKDNKSNGNNNGKEKINNDVIGFSMERFLSASPGGNNNSNTNIISNNNIIVTSNNIAVTGLSSSMAISRIILPATTTSNTNATIATSIHANEDILPRDARNDNDHDNNNNISGSDRSDIVGGSGQLTEHEILEMAEIDHASLGNVPPRSERSLYEITSVVSSNDDNDNGGMDDHHDDNNNDKDSIRMGRHHSLTAQEILEMTEIDHASLGNVPPRSERAFSESSVLLPPLNDDGDSCDNHVHDENGGNNDDDDIDSGKGRRHSQSSVILTEQEILEMAEIERASVGNVPPRSVRSLSESTVDHNNDNKQQSSNNNHSSDHHIRSTNIVLQGNIDRPAQKLTELDLKKMTETDRASVENVPPRSVRSLSETSAAAPINHDRDHDNGNDENSTTHHITTVNDVANRNNRILEFDRISSESDIRANNNNNNNNNNINNEHGGGPPRRLAQLTEQEILEMTEIEDASVGNVPPRSIRSLSESSTLMDPIVTNTMGERSDSSRGEGNSLHHHHTMSNMDGSNGGSNLILDHDDDCPIPRVAQLTEQEILEMAEIDDASVGNEPPRSVRSLSETSASIEVPTGSTHAFIDAEDNIPVTIVGVSSCDSRGNDGGNDPSLGRGLPRSSFLDGSNHVKMTLEGDGTRPTLGNYSISVHGNGNGNGEGLNLSSFLLPGGTNINRYKNVPNREDRVNELMEGLIGGGTKNDGNNPPSSVYVMDGSAQEYNSKNEYHSYGAMHENMENQVSGSASRGVPTHVDICDIHNSDSEEVLPLLNSSSSRRINHRKIPVDHILNNVFSTLRSESAADTEADISYSDRYLTKGIIKRAFPERFIVLMMTLVIEMPIFYMISMESDMLCTELGRRRYQILIAFVPVTCAISGNCGVQVCSLTSKAIRHNTRLTKATFYSWILSELYVSVLLGIVVGIILGLLAYLTGEFDLLLGAAIFSSICTGIILAGLGGTLAPLIFTFLFHRDSGRMGILLQTAIQDVVGTFTMLGLSYFIITQFGESNIDSNNLCGT